MTRESFHRELQDIQTEMLKMGSLVESKFMKQSTFSVPVIWPALRQCWIRMT